MRSSRAAPRLWPSLVNMLISRARRSPPRLFRRERTRAQRSDQPDLHLGHLSDGLTVYAQDAALDDFPDLSNCQVYACGSPAMIDAAEAVLIRRGLPAQDFFSDAFVMEAEAPPGAEIH